MPAIDELRTERLRLSRIRSRDVETIRDLHSDPDVMRTLGGTRTAAQTWANVKGLAEHWREHGFGPWIAREAASGRFAGMGGLRRVSIEEIAEVEIGYALMREFWGRGLAAEVARASAHVGFTILGLPDLVSFTLPTNMRSRRVMEKVGFVYERDVTYKGLPHVLYRLTRSMWRE